MTDSVADHVSNLVKRLAHQLGRKVSGLLMLLLHNKNAGSFGAIAGFALAIVFAWRFLRSPGRPARRKRSNAATASTSSGASGLRGLGSGSTAGSDAWQQLSSLKESQAVEGTRQAAEISLAQIVRRKLNGGRKITCQLLGVILEERGPDELQKQATVRSSVIEVLQELAKCCDLYLMETVVDDESEERVLAALENAGLFNSTGPIKEKVLFCSTENGRTSFVRQLEPDWHIDTSSEIVFNLARFIRYQLHISPTTSSITASNIFTSESLEQYFSSL